VHEEKEFDEKLKDLEKILNDIGKEWLKAEMLDKRKWTLAFDEGGKRYGITLWIGGTRQEVPLKLAKCWVKLHMNTSRLLN
jgi:hypothetical protein